MIKTSREKLIHLLRLREKLNSEIKNAREEYLVQHNNEPLIWVTDHSIIRYLERVKGIIVGNELKPDKQRLYEYAHKNGIDIKKLRDVILPHQIQREIVEKDMSSYYMDGFFYGIKQLALVTIFKNEA